MCSSPVSELRCPKERSLRRSDAPGWRISRPHPRYLKIGPCAGWGQPPPCRSSRCKPVKLSGMSRSAPQRGQTGGTAWGTLPRLGGGRRYGAGQTNAAHSDHSRRRGSVRHRPHILLNRLPISTQVPDVGKSDEKMLAITSLRPQAAPLLFRLGVNLRTGEINDE